MKTLGLTDWLNQPTVYATTQVDALILESAALKLHPNVATPFLVFIAKGISKVLPRLKIAKAKSCDLSRSKEVCLAKETLSPEIGDNGGTTALTVVSGIKAQKEVNSKLTFIDCPTLIATGTEDHMADKEGSLSAARAIPKRFDFLQFKLS